MKSQVSVYIEPELLEQLDAYAARRGKSKSLIIHAALASFLSPDTPEREEAAIVKRLDRLDRRTERLERDLGIDIEMLAMLIRHWLATAPIVPEAAQAAVKAKGQERYSRFVESLGRRLASGRLFAKEVSRDFEPTLTSDVRTADRHR